MGEGVALVLPRLVVNAKTYPEGTGKRAVKLAQAVRRIEKATHVPIALAVQPVDARACAEAGAHVYAQHIDRVLSGQSTGATRWESLLDAGVEGTLLNHSERRLSPADIAWAVDLVRKSKSISLVCSRDTKESMALAGLGPSMLAVEPPELIGGSVSVTSADPGIVSGTVRAVHSMSPKLPVLCGAGVKTGKDAAAARKLGSHGVLVASGVLLARSPEAAMRDLAKGLR